MNTYVPKNYSTDNGDTLVIGGKLVIKEGAEVEGMDGGGSSVIPAATANSLGGVKLAANQAASEATELSGLVTAFNSLLSALKAAGIMAADA